MSFPISTENLLHADRGLARRRVRPRRFVPRRRRLPRGLCLLGLAAGLTLSPAPSLAGSTRDRRGAPRDVTLDLGFGEPTGVLAVQPRLDIARVFPGEILGGTASRAISMGHWRDGVIHGPELAIETRVTREVPALWRMSLRDLDAMQTMHVRYELTSLDGRRDVLSCVNDPNSRVRVRLTPLSPVVAESDPERIVVEGGLVLELDLQDVRTAGDHVGTLTVTLENY